MNFEKDYFVNSSTSNYQDYCEKKATALAGELYKFCEDKKVLDFGCATGAVLHELSCLGIDCVGTDISYWAVETGRKLYELPSSQLQYYNLNLLERNFDIALFLDVLEHISDRELPHILRLLKAPQMIVRIPVSKKEGEDFVLECSRKDRTHVQVHCKEWWKNFFSNFGRTIFMPLHGEAIYDSEGVMAGLIL